MERVTKLIVLASMAVALFVESRLAARGWSKVFPLTIATFLTACSLSVKYDRLCGAALLVFAYAFPALFVATHGRFEIGYTAIWLAGLLGVIVPNSARSLWTLPVRWKAPLVLWALTIALVWPVVVLRELDFVPAVLDYDHQALSAGGIAPQTGIVLILNATLTLGIGILWFDWLLLTYVDSSQVFQNRIVRPLIASWAIATGVALYQFFGDVRVLNGGIYGMLGRASGTMLDANVFGVIAAMCGPAAVVLCSSLRHRYRYGMAALGLLASWLGVWGSGSRTAFATAVIVLAFLLYGVRERVKGRQGNWWGGLLIAGITVGAFLAIVSWWPSTVAGPIARLRPSLPTSSFASLTAFAYELFWRRDGYGIAAVAMIRDHPLLGVGVGSFHNLTIDYGLLTGQGGYLPSDNAQNWYRHQLAEFGLLGSIGWVVWTVIFGVTVLFAPVHAERRFAATTVKSTLVGLAVISLFGMPSQNIAVTLTFWTFAFWYLELVRSTLPDVWQRPRALGHAAWATIAALAIVYVLGSLHLARHDLRVASRALRVGWPYSYGLYDPERGPNGQEQRWTRQRAVAVIRSPGPWMKLTVSANHRDIASRPVDARVWRNGKLVIDTRFTTSAPITEYIPVPHLEKWLMLETWVSRVGRPSDFGSNDHRELGLLMGWDFVQVPPSGAAIPAR